MSNAKPVDLETARDLARRLDAYDMPGTAEQMRAMAAEIEAWRKSFRAYDRAIPGPLNRGDVQDADDELRVMRRLAPPS